ncbi:hypothetical protein FRC12_005040 [Ceratobasidium sp. 428]|nr:hypothetical protein FRC12_005040 [Ceratobasidium sp. 428]
MVNPPCPATVDSLRKINAIKSTGSRTRSGNPGAPALSLDTDHGGVKVSIRDAPSTEFSDSSCQAQLQIKLQCLKTGHAESNQVKARED